MELQMCLEKTEREWLAFRFMCQVVAGSFAAVLILMQACLALPPDFSRQIYQLISDDKK